MNVLVVKFYITNNDKLRNIENDTLPKITHQLDNIKGCFYSNEVTNNKSKCKLGFPFKPMAIQLIQKQTHL